MLDAEGERVFESWVDAHTAILFKVVRVHGDADSDGEDPFQETRCRLAQRRGVLRRLRRIYLVVALKAALAWRRSSLSESRAGGLRELLSTLEARE